MLESIQHNKQKILICSVSVIAIGMSLYHIYYATLGFTTTLKLRSFHLMFATVLIFLTYPFSKRIDRKDHLPNVLDYICIGLALVVGFYIIINEYELGFRLGSPTSWDIVLGSIAVLLILEISRRTIGWPMVGVTLFFLAYGFWGNYLPGTLSHRGYSFQRIVSHLYCFTDGIFGLPIGVIASFVLLFILFGAILEKSGGGEFYINMAYSMTGKMRGGPAKTAVIASAFMGSISGSAVANVATTGTFTIPMMKKVGYKPHVAGAIESAASSGGYIMPPIMGSAIFLLCQFTGVPYLHIVKISVVPALIYFISIYAFVHFEACDKGIMGLSSEELPDFKKTLFSGGHFILGFLILLYVLIMKYSPAYAAIGGFTSVIAAGMLRKSTRMGVKDILTALEKGARNCIPITAACACAGIIVGIVSLTGVGLKFSSLVMELAAGKLFYAILLAMAAGLILSMSMIITADYIILAILAAPALISLGLDQVTAHLVILWCACYSNLTPPIALAAYTGAGIAGANTIKTALYATRIGKAFYIMPLVLAYTPILSDDMKVVVGVGIMVALSLICLEAALANYFLRKTTTTETICLYVAALLFLWPNLMTYIVGTALLAVIVMMQRDWKNPRPTG
jgi:TRAP transporter 4TM/12TM fusion protein